MFRGYIAYEIIKQARTVLTEPWKYLDLFLSVFCILALRLILVRFLGCSFSLDQAIEY